MSPLSTVAETYSFTFFQTYLIFMKAILMIFFCCVFQSTESDLSWESDDLMSQTSVSFTEFIQQYKELTDWLNQIQLVTQRQVSSLSEKYLNQVNSLTVNDFSQTYRKKLDSFEHLANLLFYVE